MSYFLFIKYKDICISIMNLKLPFKLKIKYLVKNEDWFEGVVIFHDKEYSININKQKNEKIMKVPFFVIGVTDSEILVRLSTRSGAYVQDYIKFKGTTKKIEILSNAIFQEINNNQIKFNTLEIFVK